MGRPIRTVAVSALLLGALACIDNTSAPVPAEPVIHLANPVAWPGGDLILTSNVFPGPGPLPTVLLDTLPLAVTRLDDSTLAARLPDGAGTFTLHVRLQSEQRSGTVRIAGFSDRTTARGVAGWPVPVEPGYPVVLVGAESTLVMLDTRSGAATDLPIPHSADCAISPGPSFRSGAVVAAGEAGNTCQPPASWALGAVPAPVDSGPRASSGANLWAELGPGTWLLEAHHYLWIYKSGALVLEERIESSERAVLSPDGALAIPLAASTVTQIPVLDVTSATVRYRLPLQSSDGAAFSAGGDTLFVAGIADYTVGWTPHLVAVSSASGTVLMDSAISTGGMSDLLVDPEAPWLYVLAYDEASGGYWGPVVHVFDRRTLHELAVLQPPAAIGCAFAGCFMLTLSIDPLGRKLYVLEIGTWRGPAPSTSRSYIHTFDLPPATQVPELLTP